MEKAAAFREIKSENTLNIGVENNKLSLEVVALHMQENAHTTELEYDIQAALLELDVEAKKINYKLDGLY